MHGPVRAAVPEDAARRRARAEGRCGEEGQQVHQAGRLSADVPDQQGEEPHEQERHGDQQQHGGGEQSLVDLGRLEQPARGDVAARFELPEDQPAQDEQGYVQVVPVEERHGGRT